MTRDRFAPHPPGRAARRRTNAAPGAFALVACCALAALVPLTAAGPAGADEVAELRRARDRLGVELAQLRRLTPDEEAAPGQGAATPGAQQQAPLGQVPWAQAPPGQPAQGQQTPERAGGEQGRLAGFEVRLSRIEEELRNLTGRIEQAEFEQRRVNERLERLVADLDARFRAIEGGGGAAPEGAPAAGGQAAAPAAEPADPAALAARDLPDRPPAAGAGAAPAGPRTPPAGGGVSGTGDPITQYHAAMDLLRAGDYAAAEAALEGFVAAYPEHELAANSAYWLAETRYVREDFTGAATTFARNFQTYGADAAKAPDNLLKLGMSLDALGDKEKACQVYEELRRTFPEAPAHIEQAVERERGRAGCA